MAGVDKTTSHVVQVLPHFNFSQILNLRLRCDPVVPRNPGRLFEEHSQLAARFCIDSSSPHPYPVLPVSLCIRCAVGPIFAGRDP